MNKYINRNSYIYGYCQGTRLISIYLLNYKLGLLNYSIAIV